MSGGLDSIDPARLARLRERFLDATDVRGKVADYWTDDDDLRAYDAVFAARIGWKWDAVLDELVERGFGGAGDSIVLDWGCGTGIASRRFAQRLGAAKVLLHDRSTRAMAIATERVRDELPGTAVETVVHPRAAAFDVLLISHVLDELGAADEVELLELVARSERVVWVEPGSRGVSRLLGAHRDRLVGSGFSAVAPCPHQGACSVLAHPDDRHWCHFFAQPPIEVFTDGSWARLFRRLGIDLRALPYAFLALTRRAPAGRAPSGDAARLVGRPEVGPKEARVHVCEAAGLSELRAFKGRAAAAWRALKKPNDLRSVKVLRDGDRIVEITRA